MAKKLDSPYNPGNRGKNWLKIKTVLEPLDLVITAAEYGYSEGKAGFPTTIFRQETQRTAGSWNWGKLSRV